jgi:hypothetical protein
VSPVRHELSFYITEDGVLHSFNQFGQKFGDEVMLLLHYRNTKFSTHRDKIKLNVVTSFYSVNAQGNTARDAERNVAKLNIRAKTAARPKWNPNKITE